jgi:beta-N-acetylglucosaminidase
MKIGKSVHYCSRFFMLLTVLMILTMLIPRVSVASSTKPDILSVEADISETTFTGTTVRWTCAAEGSGTLEYAWYVYHDGERVHVEWYRSQNYLDYKYTQPGTYYVRVFVRSMPDDVRVGLSSAALVVEPPPPPAILSVQANMPGPVQKGATVRWTCAADGPGTLEYAWYVYLDGERVHVEWYQSQNYLDFYFDKPGTYHVKVFVRSMPDDVRVGLSSAALVVEPPPPPAILSVQANKPGPLQKGATVRWSCAAEGPGTLEYAWYVYLDGERVHVEWYRSQNYLDFRFDKPGTYYVTVFVRSMPDDVRVGLNSAALIVEPPPPPEILSVQANKPGLLQKGATVRWSCAAEGPGTLEYAWYVYLDGERVHVEWYRSQNYLDFRLDKPGTYHVRAFVRSMPDDVRVGRNSAVIVVEGNELIEYTQYDWGFEWVLDKQMSVKPQTDTYRNLPAYVHSLVLSGVVDRGVIKYDRVRIRTSPWFGDNIYATVDTGTTVIVLDQVQGAEYEGSAIWYKIRYDNKTLYVHSHLVEISRAGIVGGSGANARETASLNAHIYTTYKSGTELAILGEVTGDTWNGSSKWYKIKLTGTWLNAMREDVRYYLDPNKNDRFQHLVLTTSSGVSVSQLNNLLSGKGILQGKGELFIEAGQTHAINEIYLVAHALHETGNGCSDLANGVEVGRNSSGDLELVTDSNRSRLTEIKTVYNMFGIGAADSNPKELGAFYAYDKGWFTPRDAIIGGAEFIGQGYLHSGQNTLYKMRWNPANPGTHQYATDIGWAVKQISRIKQLYEQLENPLLHFEIPVYK